MIAGAAAFSEMLTSDTLSSDKLTSAVGADAARSASDERGVLLLSRLELLLRRLGAWSAWSMLPRRLELPRLASRLIVGWRLGLGRFELSRRRDRPKSSSCG